MIIPSVTHSFINPTIEALMETVKKRGLQLMIGTAGETAADEAVTIEAMLAQRPCGLGLHNTQHAKGARLALRNAASRSWKPATWRAQPVDMCVSYSNRAAAQAMTAYLLDRATGASPSPPC